MSTAATEHGVVVATVGLANAPSVVEHTLSLMLALAKRLFDVDRDVRGGDYMRKLKLEAQDIGGRTVLIVGLGRIGSRLAKTLNALGMKCLGVDPGVHVRRRSRRWAASRSRTSAPPCRVPISSPCTRRCRTTRATWSARASWP